MAKKKAPAANKSAAKAAKKAKTAQKVERKEKKKTGKSKAADSDDEEEDLESILAKFQKDWEESHAVTEELVEGPPSRRANATLTACPSGNHLWCIGGEFFSEDGKAYFYNDVFRYTPEKDEWRKYVSKNTPGPRSAHATVASPIGGGKLFLFGGEFSSVSQSNFFHYRDFWVFDIAEKSWDRIETKVRPSARSGHRMAIWKNYIVLFGGFYDPGITTRYFQDLWVFDIQEYKWRMIELKETASKPSPRSGFSFLSTPDGIVLHGGYCKEYKKGQRPVGVMLEDTWFLHLSIESPPEGTTSKSKFELLVVKWERRKRPSTAYAPSLRSGCTMTAWNFLLNLDTSQPAKSTGVLFGGVTDEDTGEETLESVFHNDLNGYQWTGKGRWVSLTLKKPKKKQGGGKKKAPPVKYRGNDSDEDMEQNQVHVEEQDPDDPVLTTPLPRYNTMLAVLRNTLYIYGGIFEKGSREYTLDDFYSVQLDKMERYVCLKASGVTIDEGEESSSSDGDESGEDDDDDSDYDGDTVYSDDGASTIVAEEGDGEEGEHQKDKLEIVVEDEAEIEPEVVADLDLRKKAEEFMGVAKDASRDPETILSTPSPGETLAMFYGRSREYWAQKAHGSSDNRGKQLRRDGFTIAEERYNEYKPILQEIEKIMAEAGLDEEEIRKGAGGARVQESRNRR